MTLKERRRFAAYRHPVLLGLLLPVAVGCTDAFGSDGLGLTITVSDVQVRLDAPITITATAMNLGDSIVWGLGSSSCQLQALVRFGDREYEVGNRGCTDDLGPQGLGPGESRTESWQWDATLYTGTSVDTLPPGQYPIRAMAGEVASSARRTITVVGTPDD